MVNPFERIKSIWTNFQKLSKTILASMRLNCVNFSWIKITKFNVSFCFLAIIPCTTLWSNNSGEHKVVKSKSEKTSNMYVYNTYARQFVGQRSNPSWNIYSEVNILPLVELCFYKCFVLLSNTKGVSPIVEIVRALVENHCENTHF